MSKNIIWFLVDSVRNYHTDADDRGRLDIMDEIAMESIEFSTVVTSAPSTVMALSSMMTGWPSVYMSRTYYGFVHDRNRFPSLGNILEDKGYSNYHIVFFPEGRDLLNGLMYPIEKNLWTDSLKEDEFWTNDQVNSVLVNILQYGLKEPFFLYVHYNCRHDPNTSQKVSLGINELKKRGLWDNSIFILNSDHGYPDPKRQIKFKELREKGHDLIMTDDNILVPLFMRFPECPVKRINDIVSSLNITPTVLEILDIKFPNINNSRFVGESMLLAIMGECSHLRTPMIRIDNRYIFQPDRVAALRSDKYKYIHSWETNNGHKEEFYSLEEDKLEEKNLINATNNFVQEEIERFRITFCEYETKLMKYQNEYMEGKIKSIISNYEGIDNLLLYADCNDMFCVMIINLILDNCPEINLSVLVHSADKKQSLEQRIKGFCGWIVIKDASKNEKRKMFDLVIVPLETRNEFLNKSVVKSLKEFNFREIYYTNYNLNPEQKPRSWLIAGFSKLFKMKSTFKNDPKTFLFDLIKRIKTFMSSK